MAVDDPLVAVEHRARREQRRVGAGAPGSVIENAERRSPASSGCSQRSFCSSVPASAMSSALPESGAWQPNALGASGDVPRISCMSPSLHLAEALAAELGRQVRRPQPALLDLLLQRAQRAVELLGVEVERLERPDLLAHERRHPVELGLELGLGARSPTPCA